jgi:HAE1 family hydrophobic/amphiphilic exporter-1
MFAEFFIKRPVVATVCAFIILIAGIVTIPGLPITQYPEIAPPQVSVNASYTGASAEVIESTVTNILEQEINGTEGLRYMSSTSGGGASSINITFEAGRDIDLAAVDVQNRVSAAQAQLPDEVQRTGVTVSKQSSGFLMAIGLFTEDDRYEPLFLSNYTDQFIVDALQRISGVGDVQVFGERRYAMRIWLDPERLASRNLTVEDVATALQQQNLQVGVGRLGSSPNNPEQMYQLDLEANGRLSTPEEFAAVSIRAGGDGSLVRVGDVGRVELGAQDYSTVLRFLGHPAVGLGITQAPGSNALEVAAEVQSELARLSERFPPGLQYQTAFDATDFVEQSLSEVLFTLIQAVLLVVLVIFLFLQDWRTTLIPAIVIPASLIGTFIFVRLFGFSINTLTLFGLTLATGMVVDDAIIVVENVTRLMDERGMTPRQAAIESMRELTSAVVATSLVLMAVFVPVAFFPGSTGALYRQFALTIAFSVTVSTFLALTLTPSLSALLLRRTTPGMGPLQRFFNGFNRLLDNTRQRYEGSLRQLMRLKMVVLGLFVVLLGATAFLFTSVPSAFLPEEDQGYFIVLVQGPDGVSLPYTDRVLSQVESILMERPEVEGVFAVGGFSFTGSSANNGIVFVNLAPWENRGPGQSVQALIGQLFPQFMTITDAQVIPVNPPPIQGLGTFGGFTFQLQDRQGTGDLDSLVGMMGQILGAANQDPRLQQVFSTFSAATPQMRVEVNRDRAESLQVPVESVFRTLQSAIGSQYVNDFTLGQRNYRVYIQADQEFRNDPGDLSRLYVRSQDDQMIALTNLVTLTEDVGAQNINHFDLFRAIEITGSAAPGFSSGDAIEAMEEIAAQVLPPGYDYAWSGTSFEEIESGGQAPLIFGLGLVFVFLVLAAQYENYIDPLIIMLAVPLAVMGALLAQSLRGLENDVYCQVGLVMLIGLASKNAILIVEFANQLRGEGWSTVKAAIEASQERMRPILMTAISTLVGIFPLTIASGAGAGSRQSLGTAVFGGMFVATFLTLFMVPVLYVIVISLRESLMRPKHPPSDGGTAIQPSASEGSTVA